MENVVWGYFARKPAEPIKEQRSDQVSSIVGELDRRLRTTLEARIKYLGEADTAKYILETMKDIKRQAR
jgi:hypothetical protein